MVGVSDPSSITDFLGSRSKTVTCFRCIRYLTKIWCIHFNHNFFLFKANHIDESCISGLTENTLDTLNIMIIIDRLLLLKFAADGKSTPLLSDQKYNAVASIKTFIAEHPLADNLNSALNMDAPLSASDLHFFVRIMVDDLLLHCGPQPTRTQKSNLALSILSSFPKILSKTKVHNQHVSFCAPKHFNNITNL
jgi:hypothetical protein